MMRKTTILPHAFVPSLDIDVVNLPYADGALSMTVYSQRTRSDPLPLTPDTMSVMFRSLRNTLVTVHLPKFRVSSSLDLKDHMNDLCSNASDSSRKVKFAHLTQTTSVSVSEGEEPAVYADDNYRHAGDPVTVVFDRPFGLVLRERESGMLLYIAKVSSFDDA